MAAEYIGGQTPDGVIVAGGGATTGNTGVTIGSAATDKVGFFGATPVVQQTCTAIATTTISQVATSGKWAFATSTAAIAFVARVRAIQDKLDTLGLIDQV